MINWLVVLILTLLLLGILPVWPHSIDWGYFPSGLGGVVLILFLIWLFASKRL